MEINWTHAGPSIVAAFFASPVEFIEALTVVFAAGAVRGWQSVLGGTGLALALLPALVAVLGPALTRIPLQAVQLGLGTLLLLFGMRWLRKAILRASGVIPFNDELAAYARERATLEAMGARKSGRDRVAVATAFKITMTEGIEVVFIVIAFGTFWAGEGMGLAWPGGDWSIPALNAGFLAVALVAIPICRGRQRLLVTGGRA